MSITTDKKNLNIHNNEPIINPIINKPLSILEDNDITILNIINENEIGSKVLFNDEESQLQFLDKIFGGGIISSKSSAIVGDDDKYLKRIIYFENPDEVKLQGITSTDNIPDSEDPEWDFTDVSDQLLLYADVEGYESSAFSDIDTMVDILSADYSRRDMTYDYILLYEQFNRNLTPGDLTINSWQTRIINVISRDTTESTTVNLNIITLQEGSYIARVRMPFYNLTGKLRGRIIDSDDNVLLESQNMLTSSNSSYTYLNLNGFIELTEETKIRIQYYAEPASPSSSSKLGIAVNILDVPEIYTIAEFLKIT